MSTVFEQHIAWKSIVIIYYSFFYRMISISSRCCPNSRSACRIRRRRWSSAAASLCPRSRAFRWWFSPVDGIAGGCWRNARRTRRAPQRAPAGCWAASARNCWTRSALSASSANPEDAALKPGCCWEWPKLRTSMLRMRNSMTAFSTLHWNWEVKYIVKRMCVKNYLLKK